jgi:hypothetical protein
MIKNGAIARGLLSAALALAASGISAQLPLPPPPGAGLPPAFPGNLPTLPQIPSRDINAEVAGMIKRYGLSEDQAKRIRAILKEQTRKLEMTLRDGSLSLNDRIGRLLAVRNEEIARVSEVLTPEQRAKYEADMHPGQDRSAEVAQMTQRYGLSEDQAKQLHEILNEQAGKIAPMLREGSLSLDERINRLLVVRKEEIARVSAILTPDQVKKYEADVRLTSAAMPSANGTSESSPPSVR